jgi:hypothetical protein
MSPARRRRRNRRKAALRDVWERLIERLGEACLGEVLYWLGLIVAWPLLLLAAVEVFATPPGHWFFVAMFGVVGAVAYLVGKGCR